MRTTADNNLCVMAMFLPHIRRRAQELLLSSNINNSTPAHFEYRGGQFRLCKSSTTTVNLETLVETQDAMYSKPIGFYDTNDKVHMANEFMDAWRLLKAEGKLPYNLTAHNLKLTENALIAAYSVETIELVLEMFDSLKINGFDMKLIDGRMTSPTLQYDKEFLCNGYQAELIMTLSKCPHFFLDDDYKVRGPIAAYNKVGDEIQIVTNSSYLDVFEKLADLNLLAVFNAQ